MTKTSTDTPSRNAPCACGSGKKSKLCCGAAPPAQEGNNNKSWLLVLGLLGVIAVAIYAMMANRPASTTPPVGISNPQPWQYDVASNQYWDPTHQHWHQGRPPASAGGAADTTPPVSVAPTTPPATSLPAQTTAPAGPPAPAVLPSPATGTSIFPKPWQYDAAKNQHWDPTHQHWHNGPPPLQAPKPSN